MLRCTRSTPIGRTPPCTQVTHCSRCTPQQEDPCAAVQSVPGRRALSGSRQARALCPQESRACSPSTGDHASQRAARRRGRLLPQAICRQCPCVCRCAQCVIAAPLSRCCPCPFPVSPPGLGDQSCKRPEADWLTVQIGKACFRLNSQFQPPYASWLLVRRLFFFFFLVVPLRCCRDP
jgi:hypothetical protein